MTLVISKGITLRKECSTWAEGGDDVFDAEVNGVLYRVHRFTRVGTNELVVMQGGSFEYLVVAGGGSGARTGANQGNNRAGSGGGAGGVLAGTTTVNLGNYSIVVGSGGSPVSASATADLPGESGTLSSVFGLTASPGTGAFTMGSSLGDGTSGNGFAPGSVFIGASSNRQGGGGGGASETGVNAQSNVAGRGGNGIASSITGSSIVYGGGGGGGSARDSSGVVGAGGSGGGGAGGKSAAAMSGAPNSGGGGGGVSDVGTSGAGGSGIIIVRYAI